MRAPANRPAAGRRATQTTPLQPTCRCRRSPGVPCVVVPSCRLRYTAALGELSRGFDVALTLEKLLWALIGVLLGTAVGVLPGIGPALTVALLLPVTYKLEPVSAF